MAGKFIVFEGIDGSGKDTQIDLLVERLNKESIKNISTREPSDGPIGKLIRDALTRKVDIKPEAFGLLYTADRMNHLISDEDNYGILKAINEGLIVIENRWAMSSIAYQSDEFGYDYIKHLNSFDVCPDLTIYLDIKPERSIERLKNGHNGETEPDIFESDLERLKKNYHYYEKIISERQYMYNIVRIDAELSIDEIHEKIWNEISSIL